MVSMIIFSGGSACNTIAPAFHAITSDVCYVLGISDNGGSTVGKRMSELLRVLGGPSIGDLRSRLTRLIDTHDSVERKAIKDLLSYRLPSVGDENTIREEWSMIVEGRHRLWNQISSEKTETIRGFLVHFNGEILKRAYKCFNFRNGSIGNFFLTGARLFVGSLEASIFLFSAITGIQEPVSVVPLINTNQTASIAAELQNGQVLRGQCEISHPGTNGSLRDVNPIDAISLLALPNSPDVERSANMTNNNLVFDKNTNDTLKSPIRRIYYMNEFGLEIYPIPNPKIIHHLGTKDTLVYSIGSLYTSIIPCLILREIGAAVAQSPSLKNKILLLNGYPDRECPGYTAVDFILAITNALNDSQSIDAYRNLCEGLDTQASGSDQPSSCGSAIQSQTTWVNSSPQHPSMAFVDGYPHEHVTPHLRKRHAGSASRTTREHAPKSPPSAFITDLVYLSNSKIVVDSSEIHARFGIRCHCVQGREDDPEGYDTGCLQAVLQQIIN